MRRWLAAASCAAVSELQLAATIGGGALISLGGSGGGGSVLLLVAASAVVTAAGFAVNLAGDAICRARFLGARAPKVL